MARRQLTALQLWRAEYNYLSDVIRKAKSATRSGHVWGDFKRPAMQSTAARLRVLARMKMSERATAHKATADKWSQDHQLRLQIPNAATPEQRVA